MENGELELTDMLKARMDSRPARIICSSPVQNRKLHDSTYRLVWNTGGTVPVLMGGADGRPQTSELHENELAVGYPGSPTQFAGKQICRTFAVSYSPGCIRLVRYHFFGDDPFQRIYCNFPQGLPPHGYGLFNLLRQFRPETELDAAVECLHSLIRLTLSVLECGNGVHVSKACFTWTRIDNYLRECLHCDLTRMMVAKRFQLSPCYLSTLCLNQTGMKFNEYVRKLRLAQAAILLSLEMSLDEIASKCGFSYTNYMIRAFKDVYGIPPGKYRELHCQGNFL